MSEFFVNIEASTWSEISAILFGLMFVVLSFWVFMPARKAIYRRAEKLPLE